MGKGKSSRISRAKYYAQIGRLDLAIAEIQSYVGWENDVLMLTSLGRCYQKANQHSQALVVFKNISSWDKNPQVLHEVARSCGEMGLYNDAIETFKQIPGWELNKTVLLGIARYSEAMNGDETQEYYDQLEEKFPDFAEGRLCALVYRERREKVSHAIEKAYEELLNRFPNYFQAHHRYNLFLIQQKDASAIKLVEQNIRTYARLPVFYLLKLKIHRDKGDLDSGLDIIRSAAHQFPHHIPTQLELLRQHLLMNDLASALKVQAYCKQRFSQDFQMHRTMDKMIQLAPVIQNCGAEGLGIYERFADDAIMLPNKILHAFQFLSGWGNEYYLTGGTALRLALGLNHSCDLDFVTFNPEAITTLEEKGFYRSDYIKGLYTREDSENIIDVMISLPTPSTHSWILQSNVLSKDYTICALVCDVYGNIYDMTGTGLLDAKQRRLRMIGHAAPRLKEDPKRLLRAIWYQFLGFNPDLNLHQAIKELNPSESFDRNGINALARKHLFRMNEPQQQEYVKLLQSYGLMNKLFLFSDNEDLVETTNNLKIQLGIGSRTSSGVEIDELREELNHIWKKSISKELPEAIEPELVKSSSEPAKTADPVALLTQFSALSVSARSEKVKKQKTSRAGTAKIKKQKLTPQNRADNIISKMIRNFNTTSGYSVEQIQPLELEMAIEIIRNQLIAAFQSPNKYDEDKLAKNLAEKLALAIYKKHVLQLMFTLYKGCYSYGIRLDNSPNAINAKDVQKIVQNFKGTQKLKKH